MSVDLTQMAQSTLDRQYVTTIEHHQIVANKIFASAFPETAITEETLKAEVTDLEVGDLFLAWEIDRNSDDWYARRSLTKRTVRSVAAEVFRATLYRVVKKSAKTIQAVAIRRPYGTENLLDLGANESYTERMGVSAYRYIIPTGQTYAGMLEAMRNSTLMFRWERTRQAAKAMEQERTRRESLVRRAHADKAAPLKALVKTLNAAVGFKVAEVEHEDAFYARYAEEPQAVLREGQSQKMLAYVIVGRAALGEITQEQADQGAQALATICGSN